MKELALKRILDLGGKTVSESEVFFQEKSPQGVLRGKYVLSQNTVTNVILRNAPYIIYASSA